MGVQCIFTSVLTNRGVNEMTQLLQVKRFNNLMLLKKAYTMVMTLGNGSMVDKPRKNGWVVYGDNFAKFYLNKQEAILEMESRR